MAIPSASDGMCDSPNRHLDMVGKAATWTEDIQPAVGRLTLHQAAPGAGVEIVEHNRVSVRRGVSGGAWTPARWFGYFEAWHHDGVDRDLGVEFLFLSSHYVYLPFIVGLVERVGSPRTRAAQQARFPSPSW